jgi:hypothetical protein
VEEALKGEWGEGERGEILYTDIKTTLALIFQGWTGVE